MKSLKEWATVIGALEGGDQTILLRKGGILDTASGFKIESEKFLLFPTAEHQSNANIKEQFHGYLEKAKARPHADGYNKITSCANVLAKADINSGKTIERLSKFHIWSKSYIDERIRWNAQRPMKALFLRVCQIPEMTIPLKQEYQGCKSWIDINEDIPDGKPVLSDGQIESRLKEFKEIIN